MTPLLRTRECRLFTVVFYGAAALRAKPRNSVKPGASEVRKAPFFYLGGSFGASEATIFSKRGSPRSGSHKGCSFKAP